MPLGLDAHIHLNYVTDDLADGEASLDWGEVRTEGSDYSTPEEVKADDRWQVWHAIIGLWIAIFGSTLASLHILSLAISIGCLATVYWCTSKISSQENAIALTAICSIYSPLMRASGRLYQENIVLLLATLAVFGLLQIYRKKASDFVGCNYLLLRNGNTIAQRIKPGLCHRNIQPSRIYCNKAD